MKKRMTAEQLEKFINDLNEYKRGALHDYIVEQDAKLADMRANNLKTVPGGEPPPNPPGTH